MNKKINTILAVAIIFLIAGTFGFLFWPKGAEQKPAVSVVKKDNKLVENKNSKNATAQKALTSGFAYRLGNNIILTDPENGQERIVFSSDRLIDFDYSHDGKYLVYSLREDGFSGNADIYFLEVANGKTVRLTEKNNIASFSPKIYADGKKVAYLRRTFDEKRGKLRDGEIWRIDASGEAASSVKLFGDESKSWFELDPNTRCCVCGADDEPYVPESMLELSAISEDGNFISYREGDFHLMCFAGFQMVDKLYDVKKRETLLQTKVLATRNNEYYIKLHSQSPSDPFPFCIRNTFFDKNDQLVWDPDKIGDAPCQHDYYYEPTDFTISGKEVDMLYLGFNKASNEAVLARSSLVFGSDLGAYFLGEHPADILYQPKLAFARIVDARKLGNFVAFTEWPDGANFPTLNILDLKTKNILRTINLDNAQQFGVVSSD
ncbi:MAG: hypothetical protein WAV73_06335 [Candidatus Moraniibacteriota bacterium]